MGMHRLCRPHGECNGQAEQTKSAKVESRKRCRLVEGQDEQVSERSRLHHPNDILYGDAPALTL